MFKRYVAAVLVVAIPFCFNTFSVGVDAFLVPQRSGWIAPRTTAFNILQYVSLDSNTETTSAEDDDYFSDEDLLRTVPRSQLVDLCEQFDLPTKGSKEILLKGLRKYADQQAELERKRRQERIARVEESGQEGKERYEIVSQEPEDDDDDDEGYFYFELPTAASSNETASSTKRKAATPNYVTNNVITAPPPPPTEPDENGERVVTVYSTKDHNDMTGVAAAQPGQNAFSNDAMMEGSSAATSAPWDMQDSRYKAEATSKELEEAKETVTELVHVLLTMTGAPAFREEFSEGLTPGANGGTSREFSSSPEGFVGFDPSKVPTDILVTSSQALRASRGQVLQDVLRDYELRAVGHDGMAGDDVEKGGGHYREVSKVRAFLEGYRRAEVRRVARETTTILLDKLVSEGIEGLDLLLASMTKTSEDTGNGGELNDALLDYLNDAIRQQEKKVEQLVGHQKSKLTGKESSRNDEPDPIDGLWNVTSEDGKRVETLDPNDPKVQKVLKEEFVKSQANGEMVGTMRPTPETAPEQLLLLLTLLRERIKAEAAFSNDEKGRNLRILAYCLHVGSDKEREAIITKESGSSIDVSGLVRAFAMNFTSAV